MIEVYGIGIVDFFLRFYEDESVILWDIIWNEIDFNKLVLFLEDFLLIWEKVLEEVFENVVFKIYLVLEYNSLVYYFLFVWNFFVVEWYVKCGLVLDLSFFWLESDLVFVLLL